LSEYTQGLSFFGSVSFLQERKVKVGLLVRPEPRGSAPARSGGLAFQRGGDPRSEAWPDIQGREKAKLSLKAKPQHREA